MGDGVLKHLVIVAALAGLLVSVPCNPVVANSLDAVMQRLDALEKENAALRTRVRRLEGGKAAASDPLSAMASAQKPVYAKAPTAPPPVRRFNWTGVYIGAHTGHALGDIDTPSGAFDFTPRDFNGWFGGGRIGANYQFANDWVAGVVADVSAADISTQQDRVDGVDFFRLQALATLRGRIGYAWDRHLLYATGGLAWGQMRFDHDRLFGGNAFANSITLEATERRNALGYAAGFGAETALLDDFTFNVEYLWTALARQTYTFVFPAPLGSQTGNVGWYGQTLKFGVNWLLR